MVTSKEKGQDQKKKGESRKYELAIRNSSISGQSYKEKEEKRKEITFHVNYARVKREKEKKDKDIKT
jgi:hypothetical protein